MIRLSQLFALQLYKTVINFLHKQFDQLTLSLFKKIFCIKLWHLYILCRGKLFIYQEHFTKKQETYFTIWTTFLPVYQPVSFLHIYLMGQTLLYIITSLSQMLFKIKCRKTGHQHFTNIKHLNYNNII